MPEQPNEAHQDRSPHAKEARREPRRSLRDAVANPAAPTKPGADDNPTGVDHNPAQGSPATRRNPEAGKE